MSDRVLVPVPGLGVLALELAAYQRALAEGAQLTAAQEASEATDEPLLDAEHLAEALSLPVTWLEQAARERRIPSIQAGWWRRFKRSAVERALSANGKQHV